MRFDWRGGALMRTRVKICGITRIEDALAAVAAGVDAIGLVFYRPSPRYIEPHRARDIRRALPPFVSVVGLFVNPERAEVEAVLEQVGLDVLQFHGSETAGECVGFGRPYIKAIGMQPGVDLPALMAAHPDARAFLLDAWQPAIHGGGGVAFDWHQVPSICNRPLVLAGGLTADNVADAIAQTRPFAVDVSSGVESDRGIKSEAKIQAFMRGVERGDASRASD